MSKRANSSAPSRQTRSRVVKETEVAEPPVRREEVQEMIDQGFNKILEALKIKDDSEKEKEKSKTESSKASNSKKKKIGRAHV